MDSGETIEKTNPREKANTVSILIWWWTLSLFKKGYNKVLGTEDLYKPLKSDKSSTLGDRLEKKWKAELVNAKKKKREPSLFNTIFWTFFREFFILGIYQFFNELILGLGGPLLLGSLLAYFKPEPTTTYEFALISAGGLCATYVLETIFMNLSYFMAFHLGGRFRIAVCSIVYRKALRLSKSALGETAPGKVVNLVANDVTRFDLVTVYMHYMWSAPLLTVVVGVLLYLKAGYAGLIGIVAIFTVVPIQAYTGTLSSRYREETAIKTDERVRLMDEIVSGVQVIKMYAWEKPFCALIALARKMELKVVAKSSYIRGIYMTFNLFTTRVALYCTLLGMLYTGEHLTADKVFVFSAYFGMLSFNMSGMFVRGFAEIAECLVAVRRLQTFLTYDEFQANSLAQNNVLLPILKDTNSNDNSIKEKSHDVEVHNSADGANMHVQWVNNRNHISEEDTSAVRFKNVTAKWDESSSDATLDDINVNFEKGKFYIVIGMVGSGKSSFLSAILREINILQGDLRVNGKISYADQDSWVFGATVRQNILFGQEFDKQRYQRVVKACALVKDFEQLPQGDLTIVGERGSSLSGGQKARINLARSVYRQADIYLLDDPLSAVDAHVGKHLFEECLQRYLKGKTRILATHQLQFIKGADAIILVDQGRVQEYKDYLELLRDYPEYKSLVAEEKEDVEDSASEHSLLMRQFSRASTTSKKSDTSKKEDDESDEEDETREKFKNIEGTSRGVVKGSILLKYLRVGSSLFYALSMYTLFVVTQFLVSLNDYYINFFVTAEESRAWYEQVDNGTSHGENPKVLERWQIWSQDTYIIIYSVIVFSIFFVAITRSYAFFSICLRTSQRLHDLIFSALIRASMRFFDTNPSGRILNRFSKDMMALDEQLPKALLDASQIMLVVSGGIIVAITVNPLFMIPIAVISPVFYWLRKVYLKTSKNIKRLEGMTRSPVFTHLNATLNGLSTIRAYQAERILEKEFDNLQDTHTSSWYMFISVASAFGFSLDMLNFSFTGIVIFSFLLLGDTFSGGEVGLAITQVMAVTGAIQYGMRQASEVANQMMAVERVLEYTQIPPEPNLRDKGYMVKKQASTKQDNSFLEIPKNWPSTGFIEFKSVFLRYSEEDTPVLKDLNLKIMPTEKVGIVGRTGAGKSSLISALFRIAKVDGVIEIDGIDTGKIALEDLRKSISIIPQLPVLFSGTLRRNLDPFNEYKDELLWQVLDEVELKDAVIATGHGLDHHVQDRGSNYSVGQRQLICLARAILRNNRVLMLDEATANVDPQTDSLIQQTIRTKFADCTVLTVAHRLNTIMDSDKVLVMDKGYHVEFDHPHILLQNKNGHFTSLVKETGQAMYEQLCSVAEQAYLQKYEDIRL